MFSCKEDKVEEKDNNEEKNEENNNNEQTEEPKDEKVTITFVLNVPDLEDGYFDFVLVGSFSNWKVLDDYILYYGAEGYTIDLEFDKDTKIEYKYVIKSDNEFDKVELALDGSDIENREVIADNDKTVRDTVERFKNVKLADEKEEVIELADDKFYDNDSGRVHQLNYDGYGIDVIYQKGSSNTWACIVRPLEEELIGRLYSFSFSFILEKDVSYLIKLEGGDGTQEETVIGTGGIQEYVLKVSSAARNSTKLVIFGHKGLAGTSEKPLTGEYRILSIKATVKDPEPDKPYVPGENPIHILAIGNSFSDDGLWLLYDILEQLGYDDIIVANLYIGGCNVSTHKSNLAGDKALYTYRVNRDGEWVSRDGYKASTALLSEKWDFISLQQASDYSGLVDKYVTNDIDYVYQYAKEIAIINNENVKLVWHMTWAYQQNSTHAAFGNYNKIQMTMYNGIINAVKKVIVPDEYCDIIVPSGTTIQNLRTSFLGDNITRDGYHLNEAYGRYAAALTWAIALTGKDISSINRPGSVNSKYDPLCKEAAINACLKPFEITESVFKHDDAIANINFDNYNLLPSSEYIIGNGYYNSQDNSKFLTPIQDGSTFCNGFITTKLFTKNDLPVGSIIVLGEGYQYRPEGWIDEAKQATRNGNTTEKIVVVDEEWWSNYIYRAFNLSKVGGGVLTGDAYDAAIANFKIYIPKK